MCKILWHFVLLLTLPILLCGKQIDSLQQQLKSHFLHDDKPALLQTYMALGKAYAEAYQHREALEAFQAGLKLSKELGDPLSTFKLYSLSGLMHYWLDAYPEALQAMKQAQEMQAEIPLSERAANLSRMAEVYVALGIYEEALAAQLEALKIAEVTQDDAATANAHRVLSSIYWYQQEFDLAKDELHTALEQFRKMGEAKSVYTCLAALSSVHAELKMYQHALRYAEQSYRYADSIGYPYGRAFSKGMMGVAHKELGNTALARMEIEQAIAQFDSLGIGYEAADFALVLSDIYLLEQQYRQAAAFLEKLRQTAEGINSLALKSKVYERLANCYAEMGKTNQAFQYQKKYSAVRDSLLSEEKVAQVARMEARYQLEKKSHEADISRKDQRIAQDKWYLLGFSAMLIAFLLLAWWMYVRYRSLQASQLEMQVLHRDILRSYQHLTSDNTELRALTAMLSKELGEVVSSLHHVRKAAEAQGASPPAREIGQEVEKLNQLQAGLQMYHTLETGQDRKSLDTRQMITQAIEHLPKYLHGRAKQIRIRQLPPKIWANPQQMTQLFGHLIENAVKFNEAPQAEVHISCEEDEQYFTFKIEDNGTGIDPADREKVFELFYTGSEAGEGSGLGLAMAKKIVEQHQGKIWLESSSTGGTIVLVQIPKGNL